MAKQAVPRSRNGSLPRRAAAVASIIPLAIGLSGNLGTRAARPSGTGGAETALVSSAANAEPAVCEDVIDEDDCHTRYPAGCSTNTNYDAALSFLKDLLNFPTGTSAPLLMESDFTGLEAKIPKGVSQKNHGEFLEALKAAGEGELRSLVGFLYPSKLEGSEASNCKLDGIEEAVDFHLYIGFDASVAAQLRAGKDFEGTEKRALNRQSVIVEMTPHFRAHFEPDWTFEHVKKLYGRQVKVVGQLLLDNEHNLKSQNCGLAGADLSSCWRASAWELHPVTQFWICPTEACAVDSRTWVTIGQASK